MPNGRPRRQGRPPDVGGFFEVVAKQPILCVADRKERVEGWGCQGCGRRVFRVRGKFNPFIAADDVPRPTPKVLAIQSGSLQLALPAVRWRALRGRAGSKGIVAKAVTVLPSSRVWRRARLPSLTRAQVRAARKQFEWQLTGGKWDLLPGDVPVGHKR